MYIFKSASQVNVSEVRTSIIHILPMDFKKCQIAINKFQCVDLCSCQNFHFKDVKIEIRDGGRWLGALHNHHKLR